MTAIITKAEKKCRQEGVEIRNGRSGLGISFALDHSHSYSISSHSSSFHLFAHAPSERCPTIPAATATSTLNGYTNTSNPSLVPSQNAALSPVIRKKLMGFVGFSNLPNQVHRKSVRKGFQFTAMVVGKSPTPSRRVKKMS